MAITHVATMTAAGAPNSSADAVTGTADTSGADFVLFAAARDSAGTPVDSKGNILTSLTRYANGTATGVQFFYAAGTPTVGASHSGSLAQAGNSAAIAGIAFAGVHATPFDQENGSGGTGASPQTTGSITPSENGCVVITALGSYGNPVSNSPLTITTSANTTNFSDSVALGYEIQTTATARDISWAWSGGFGNNGGRTVASFKAAGAAAGRANFLTLLGVS